MKNLDEYNVIELQKDECSQTNGGSFGYDAGWFIYWSLAGMGTNYGVMAEALAVYAMHYSKES